MRTAEQTANLKRFISFLWAQPDSAFIMDGIDCGTACCVEGWRRRVMGCHDRHFRSGDCANEQFGISRGDWHRLIVLDSGDMTEFDKLKPHIRKRAMILVLEQQLSYGGHDWLDALLSVAGERATARIMLDGSAAKGQEVRPLQAPVRGEPSAPSAVQRALPNRAVPREEAALLLEEVDA